MKIELDNAFIYDLLSIRYVKLLKSGFSDVMAYHNHKELTHQILNQVGEIHGTIINSLEYADLIDVNSVIFDRVKEINVRTPTGEDAAFIDSNNYKRFVLKKALQEKFFPEQKLMEQKIGYDK